MPAVDATRKEILNKVSEFYGKKFAQSPFIPGITPIPVSGRVFDAAELTALVNASLDFWLTSGRYAKDFERELSRFLGGSSVILCNSGSSANLLAVSALTSEYLGSRHLKENDEVITTAAGFPSTVNPIFQNRLKPVFIDIDLGTYNASIERLAGAITPRTRAIMLAHTLGNPFCIKEILAIAKKYNLWVIEDNCDALGSLYQGKPTGTFGDISTISFYPAHHITTGEGGCVITFSAKLKKIICSFRDWGRDCWCDTGKANTCGKRFEWQLGSLPSGYDHKYIYSHIGYNLKMTDMQAAVGLAQTKKLYRFCEARRKNWVLLRQGLKDLEEFFILPEATPESDPSWFGFLLTIRPESPFSRTEILNVLEEHNIATRLLFGGNLTKQPAYQHRTDYRIAGNLKNTDIVMWQSFWIGVYPGITRPMIDYMLDVIHRFVRKYNALTIFKGKKRKNQ